ncbi:glycosyltransferase family 2 protein [Chitinophaga agrisoli]|uniref:Glycosyltransferase family 2 protein n=1 Tax=Chitinophaga agrisoli TaxID=2607653 RepID=A0A5B2VLW0_9BACT|nr:glycosyltransferase [Chitinophaga agrisoli]KAA2239895.1 glycosyltransferase family 2 protein [Chitinophaga agrisoli]
MSLVHEHIRYSLVICTYNPEERILQRCLQAIAALDTTGFNTEVILVDNNCTIPLISQPYIQAFLRQLPDLHIIAEPQQGVSYARIAAIGAARGEYIVYFDYDNEPESSYLQQLNRLHIMYPMVGAWGPGKVQVDFIDGISPEIEEFARGAFQQRNERKVNYAFEPDWQPCYPFGTGLCTKAAILKQYAQFARLGTFTLSGRKGHLLTSGEDTQMVLLCLREGYAAGVAPELQLTHIIPGSRANVAYLRRLVYGAFACYAPSWLEVFPDLQEQLERQLMPASAFSWRALEQYVLARCSRRPFKTFQLVEFIATQAGTYQALNKPLPPLVRGIIKYLHVA